VVVSQSNPVSSGKRVKPRDRHSSPEAFSNRSGSISGNLDQGIAVSSLQQLIAAGDHRLDPILGTIADAALQLTGASGAALAMWKDGAMVCRARSGDTAPALGARLNANTGISGECLRTGKIQHCSDTENDPLVDVEVCRSLGLRSIAVLPIHGWRGINGILEVFSTRSAAFTEPHIALLQQLAALAERARATQPHDASPAAPKLPSPSKLPSADDTPRTSGLLPASDRVGDLALAAMGSGRRSRPLLLGAIGLVAIALLALVIWLGWRGPDEVDGKSPASASASAGNSSANVLNAAVPDQRATASDQVWKKDPGGELLSSSDGKPSAGAPVKFAAKVDVLAGKQISTGRSPLLADLADKVATDPAVPHATPDSPTELRTDPEPGSGTPDSRSDEPATAEPLSLSGGANPSSLNGVLSAKVSPPGLSAPVSTGVSGGQLVHRVAPVYPAEALVLRQQGTVILAAVVMEDGTVRDVKAVAGPAVFGPSAVEAVKQWRYKPYVLDGKAVKSEVRIAVDFKFPESRH
jgi:TonB family protein